MMIDRHPARLLELHGPIVFTTKMGTTYWLDEHHFHGTEEQPPADACQIPGNIEETIDRDYVRFACHALRCPKGAPETHPLAKQLVLAGLGGEV